MKTIKLLSIAVAGLLTMQACKNNQNNQEQLTYPVTKKVDTVDTYFGVKVADPYRWLENDTTKETSEWVNAQNKVTFDYLAKIPFREKIKERLTKIWNFPKYGTPFKKGNNYFFFKNEGMQNQSVLYVRDGLNGEPKVFLDPNKLSEDGTVALGGMSLSNDGKYMAYATSKGGSDWNDMYVMEVSSIKKLNDELKWTKFSGMAWKGDGFYYSRYDAPKGSELSAKNEYHKVYYHKVGTPQSEDKLIYENNKYPLRNYSIQVTEDEQYMFMYETEGTSGNSIYYKKANDEKGEFKLIAKGFDFEYGVIDNIGDKFIVQTNHGAAKNRVVMMEAPYNDTTKWKTIIPEKEEVLQGCQIAGGKLILQYMKDACSKAYAYNMDGTLLHEIALPGLGTLGGFSGDKDENIGFYSYTSFTFPNTIYKYDITKNASEIYIKPEVKDFNADDYETKQVFYSSTDGTKVPMFIVHKKGLKMDGTNPTYLYGYGGFNISLTPSFSVSRLILLENGGVYAMPNLRGGGEYGEEWHQAGTKLRKQNVFNDFISAAEYLIKEKYTSSDKLTISGGSNGGLLVGACMTQRPELFKVALPAVGVLDMLRFHKFTIGWAWTGDYGSSDDSAQFHYIYKYSPLHNIKEGVEYPATMVTTADHDDRVVPAHSFKFISTLQEKYKGKNPVVIRIETMAGHGAGKPTAKIIEEATDMWSFVFFNVGVTPKY